MSASVHAHSRGRAPLVAVLVTLLLVPVRAAAADEGVAWYASYDEAAAAAAASAKPMLVYVWTSGRSLGQIAEDVQSGRAEPGPRLQAYRTAPESFWTPELVELSKKFVCVKIDQKTDRATARKFGRLPPVVVFADPWGHEIDYYRGGDFPISTGWGYDSPYMKPEDVVPLMRAIPTDFSPLREAAAALGADPKSAPALVAYGEFYRASKLYSASATYYTKALATEAVTGNTSVKESVELALGLDYIKMGDYVSAREIYDRLLREPPGPARADLVMLGLLTAQLGLGERAAAEGVYKNLKTKYPDSPATKQAEANLKDRSSR